MDIKTIVRGGVPPASLGSGEKHPPLPEPRLASSKRTKEPERGRKVEPARALNRSPPPVPP